MILDFIFCQSEQGFYLCDRSLGKHPSSYTTLQFHAVDIAYKFFSGFTV